MILERFFYTITLSVLLRQLRARERRSLVEHVTGVAAGLLGLAARLRGNGSRSRSGDRRSTVGGSAGNNRSNRLGGTRARAGAVHGRTRNLVLGGTRVRVEENTRLRVSVELSGQSSLRVVGSGASDVNVEALRVVLGTVLGASAVESDDLVAENVASSSESLRDGGGPGVVVLDKIGGSPSSVKTSSIDLNPLKLSRVSSSALALALSNVGQDRTDVRLRPCRPLELNRATSLDAGRGLTGRRLDVASNVRCSIGIGRDEAVVEVLGGPSGLDGSLAAVLDLVVGFEVVAGLVDTVNLDAGDGSVGEDGGGEGADESSCDLERHGDGLFVFKEWL